MLSKARVLGVTQRLANPWFTQYLAPACTQKSRRLLQTPADDSDWLIKTTAITEGTDGDRPTSDFSRQIGREINSSLEQHNQLRTRLEEDTGQGSLECESG